MVRLVAFVPRNVGPRCSPGLPNADVGRVRTLAALWIALACGGNHLAAQVAHGVAAPAPRLSDWRQGEPVPFATEQAPACTVYSFYTHVPHRAWLSRDADYLGELQRRLHDRGARFVIVVADPKRTIDAALAPCAVAADADGRATRAWLGDEVPVWNLVAVDRTGAVAFVGRPEAGLVDAVEGVLAGRFEPEAERRAFALRADLPVGFDDMLAATGEKATAELLRQAPRDGCAFGFAYLTAAQKRGDPEGAGRVLADATARLSGESRPFAAFADLALRGEQNRAPLAAQLAMTLAPAAAAAPQDPAVQLAWLRALVHARRSREVGRQAIRVRKLVHDDGELCLEFAEVLSQDEPAAVHRDLAEQALARAVQLGAGRRLLHAARYQVALRCAEDQKAAKAVLEVYLDGDQARVSINNDCWYLMTEVATMGRYDRFAEALAQRMLEQRDAMDGFEFDTTALAMFRVGRLQDAVELQQIAIEKGGAGNPEYQERLDRYKAAVAAAPR